MSFIKNIKFEYKITILYLVIGLLWIFFSDTVFGILISDKQFLTKISMLKGFLYVIVTSIILFYFVKRHMQKLQKAEIKLKQKNKEVENQNIEYKQLNNELQFAKEKAEENDRLKTAFLQNISHEIRTPMNAILGFSELLTNKELNEYKKLDYIKIIQNSTNHLLSIVNDVLSISLLETKQQKIDISKIFVNDILYQLYNIFVKKAEENNLELLLKIDTSKKDIFVYSDKTKLTQILNNLIVNAFKFTQEGYIEFGYNLKVDFLEFFVKDTGIGIKEEVQQIIFERFCQADKKIQFEYGGTGLGLSISKGFTELLGGKIWVISQINKGATFYFTIPYKIEESYE